MSIFQTNFRPSTEYVKYWQFRSILPWERLSTLRYFWRGLDKVRDNNRLVLEGGSDNEGIFYQKLKTRENARERAIWGCLHYIRSRRLIDWLILCLKASSTVFPPFNCFDRKHDALIAPATDPYRSTRNIRFLNVVNAFLSPFCKERKIFLPKVPSLIENSPVVLQSLTIGRISLCYNTSKFQDSWQKRRIS